MTLQEVGELSSLSPSRVQCAYIHIVFFRDKVAKLLVIYTLILVWYHLKSFQLGLFCVQIFVNNFSSTFSKLIDNVFDIFSFGFEYALREEVKLVSILLWNLKGC
jgi:hypothetical protein